MFTGVRKLLHDFLNYLRDECHGLINGMPVHWRNECLCREHECLREVLDFGHASIEEKHQINRLDLAISQAITEREFVESYGHFYVRAPMADGDLPHDLFVDQFVQFIQDVSPNHWIHFHCRTGGEKASTFVVLSDIIQNGRQMNLEDILAKHELMSEADLAEFSSEEERLDHIQQKLDFISDFYAYCQEVPDFSIRWSKWISQQSPFTTIRQQGPSFLLDRLICGCSAKVCVRFNDRGVCVEYVTIEAHDNQGNYVKGTYFQDSKGPGVEFSGGNNRDSGGRGGRGGGITKICESLSFLFF